MELFHPAWIHHQRCEPVFESGASGYGVRSGHSGHSGEHAASTSVTSNDLCSKRVSLRLGTVSVSAPTIPSSTRFVPGSFAGQSQTNLDLTFGDIPTCR